MARKGDGMVAPMIWPAGSSTTIRILRSIPSDEGEWAMRIYGEHEQRTIDQLERCASVEDGALAVLCADGHVGYSQPIGGAIAYRDHISPSGVGYDIGCGNKAVRTNLMAGDPIAIPAIMDEIVKRISFGVGRHNDEPVDHPVFDKIRDAPFAPQRQLLDLAVKQLGTVGAGNHYVDLFVDERKCVWVGVHFGSRRFGHKTASGFLALAQGKRFEERAGEGEMDSPPIVFGTGTDLGQSYIEAMTLAGEYAYAGRDVVVDKVLEILGAEALEEVHNHHNFAWRETHDGEDFWVVRKGCTPAFPGQRGFVGATMGESSVILEGTEAASEALFSTVHGAGRVMSRTQAAGKSRPRWTCLNRDCDWFQGRDEHVEQPPGTRPSDWACPKCGRVGLKKIWQKLSPGLIDFDAVRDELAGKRIELRGGAADEAPGAYKRLEQVLAAQGATIRVLHHLRPIGVAMAGADVYDPFKD
jgi:tRNA-splicing ligase RtcB (3'-phosphate/5'-hydroxy nucleic acid ligase)